MWCQVREGVCHLAFHISAAHVGDACLARSRSAVACSMAALSGATRCRSTVSSHLTRTSIVGFQNSRKKSTSQSCLSLVLLRVSMTFHLKKAGDHYSQDTS